MDNDLFSGLLYTKKARTARFSSWDQEGKNQDYWLVPPYESIVLGETEGPGKITHIWMTTSCRRIKGPGIVDPIANGDTAPVNEIHPALGVVWDVYDPFYYRKILIKITWDDQETPSVLAPLGDFFCIGHSLPGNFSSLPFNVSLKPEEAGKFGAPCAVSCYFPMPFNKKAKIEIINENDIPFILYFHIDYELYDEPFPENTAYFHACWRREKPCAGWGNNIQVNTPEINRIRHLSDESNYVILNVKGEGHYVGCNLSVYHFQGTWWGEGDDMFVIDGEDFPSIVGTGTEDYFNHAWGMQRNAFPFYGTIVHEGDTNGYQVSYRFHITDPIRFRKSLKVSIEHGHANHLSDDWSSTAYWYQMLPTQTHIFVPPVEDRIPIVPVLPKIGQPHVELDEEMQEAQENYAKRWKEYYAARRKIEQEKEDKARRESKLNIKYGIDIKRKMMNE